MEKRTGREIGAVNVYSSRIRRIARKFAASRDEECFAVTDVSNRLGTHAVLPRGICISGLGTESEKWHHFFPYPSALASPPALQIAV